jgi:hypothetical protein
MLIDQSGERKGELKRGEQKSLQTDRVILVPGPPEEVAVVGRIYEMFVKEGKRESEIADRLNAQGSVTDLGRRWNRGTVAQVLTNEKYIGNNVYNRTSFKLKRKHVTNSPRMWIRADGVFSSIVPPELFYTAQGILQERSRRFADDELIVRLKSLARRHPTLSASLIDAAEDLPTSATFRSRFGSLIRAYQLAGYVPDRDFGYVEINRHLRELHPGLIEEVVERLAAIGASVARDPTSGLLLINGEYSASMALSRCRQTSAGRLRWWIKLDERIAPDITILVRMDPENEQPTDFYLFPLMDVREPKVVLCETNGAYLDTYRFDDLDYFARLASRTPIEAAA